MGDATGKLKLATAVVGLLNVLWKFAVSLVPGLPAVLAAYLTAFPDAISARWFPAIAAWGWLEWSVIGLSSAWMVVVIAYWSYFRTQIGLTDAARDLYEAFENSHFQRLQDALDKDKPDPLRHWREELIRSAPCYGRRPESRRWHRLEPGFWRSASTAKDSDDLFEGPKRIFCDLRFPRWSLWKVKYSPSRRKLRSWIAAKQLPDA